MTRERQRTGHPEMDEHRCLVDTYDEPLAAPLDSGDLMTDQHAVEAASVGVTEHRGVDHVDPADRRTDEMGFGQSPEALDVG